MTTEIKATAELDAKVDLLLVDDSPKNLIALEAMLESLGQNMVTASSGRQALRHLLERDFALVLLDIQMPELDGFQTAQLIRARERTRYVPIIFLTAFGKDDSQIHRAYELGAVDFLFKPIVPFILRSKVRAFVELYRKTMEIKRQAALLRDIEHREEDRRLTESLQRWEAERLREEIVQEREIAATLASSVAERGRAEAALQVSNTELSLRNSELAEADRRKDAFLVMLAHELRNPMAPIVASTQLLRTPDLPASVVGRSLDVLDRQVGHMVRLVDDLLDVSRVTTGKIELRRAPVSLSSIVGLAVQISTPFMAQGAHCFTSSLPDEVITLDADSTRMAQVVANLLNNAAKFSPHQSKIELSVERDGEEAVIRVRDHGIGISPDLLDTVFGLFVQLDRDKERAQGGLGIGLTLVKNLVEMHGGSVSASSDGLGTGSEFSVRLPIAEGHAAVTPRAEQVPLVDEGSRGCRVVVVEDNDDIREVMKDLLESWGCAVTTAADGPTGVEAVLLVQPDIAFIDIGLPGLDGYQVVAALRERAPDLGAALVALTGYGRPEDRRKALAAGFDLHSVKPMVPAEILKLVIASRSLAAAPRSAA